MQIHAAYQVLATLKKKSCLHKSFSFHFWYWKWDSSLENFSWLVDNFNLYISVHCWFMSLSFLHRRTNLTRSLFHSAPVTSQDCDADSQGVASCSINWFSLHKDSYNSIERPTLPVLCSVGEGSSRALLPLLNSPQVSAHSHSLASCSISTFCLDKDSNAYWRLDTLLLTVDSIHENACKEIYNENDYVHCS